MSFVSCHSHFVIDVEDAFLYLVVDLPRRVDERLLDVGRRLGRRLHEYETVLAREGLSLFPLDVAARLQITWEGENGQLVNTIRACSKYVGPKYP